MEVRLLAEMVGRDATSTTGNNLVKMRQETGLDPWSVSVRLVRDTLPLTEVPASDEWRLPFLEKLLKRRYELEVNLESTDDISATIDSLCSS